MANSITFTMCLLSMATALMSVDCCVLKRAKGPTNQRVNPVTIIGTMGSTVRLLGYLNSPDQHFYKDDKIVYATEHIYELSGTPMEYQVYIRFLTCNDEGLYRVGRETFRVLAKAEPCGMFYFTAKVDSVTKAAFVNPLDGVIRISMLYIHPENHNIWSVVEVWNDTMSRTRSPARCCVMTHDGNTFWGYGDREYQYFMYQRQGRAEDTCSDVNLAAKKTKLVLPELGNINTSVELLDISDDIQNIINILDELKKPWPSASGSPKLNVFTVPFLTFIMAATMSEQLY
ncbi:uncharacterized protein LOC134310243 [Trichomycterus rosablanca]|uniref:uncharacterized protein LOC134310243 n=1 Tax=Trichomycterus rosablanca TaxID=2290929 RepID=UPI002F35343C